MHGESRRQRRDVLIPVDLPTSAALADADISPTEQLAGSEMQPAAPTTEPPLFVLYLTPDSRRVRDEVRAVCDSVEGFLQLPLLVAAATREQAERLSRLDDVRVVEVGPALDGLVPLIRGLDLMATIEVLSRARVNEPYIVGGTQRGVGGYPKIAERDGELFIVAEQPSPFDTRPARLQIVNLSLEPPRGPRGQWPWADSDPINMATNWLAPRLLFVFAAGNQDPRFPGRETTSAWAEAPWVLSVGATADEAGTELAEYSNAGVPGIPMSGPDVVAWGASLVNTAKSATSYAAPKVSRVAAICASAIEQLSHQASDAGGDAAEGIPLVGYGWIDTNYRGIEREEPRWPIPAQPVVGVDPEGFRRALAACTDAGMRLNFEVTPARLRRMVLSSARPIPAYQPHEVGAGFVSEPLVLDWLLSWRAEHLASFLAETPSPDGLQDALPDAPIFGGRTELEKLVEVVDRTAPIWRWDFVTSEFGMRRDSTTGSNDES